MTLRILLLLPRMGQLLQLLQAKMGRLRRQWVPHLQSHLLLLRQRLGLQPWGQLPPQLPSVMAPSIRGPSLEVGLGTEAA